MELGCGVGLLGCVISRFCSHITLSDHHESVLSAAQHTLQINCVENGKVVPLDWTTRGPVEEEYDVTIAAGMINYFLFHCSCTHLQVHQQRRSSSIFKT